MYVVVSSESANDYSPKAIVLSGCIGYLIFAYFTEENEL